MDSAGTAVRPVADTRDTASVGRRARLELVFARRDGRTVLVHAYAEPPFRVGRTFPDGDAARMILASSGPGVFGGDDLAQHISVGPGARVRLTSQSALQIHPSPTGGTARLRSTYRIEEDGELECEWDPVIPFADARLDQRIDVSLAEHGFVCWSDALMAGRVASPVAAGSSDGSSRERWAFAELSHELKVTRADVLEYLERYRIAPREHPVDHVWMAGQACYIGSVLASGRPVEAAAIADVHERLARIAGVRAAADRLDRALCLVRLLGDSGVPFRDARGLAARALAS
ncbi:MAG: hypothetical protein A3H97_11975 [Acidobacteria bacterium RIFCSPLOWO2_02_FULL_65_29]|nr:MAG: hypothetical protein A3H97_11975 [Acidobacteria bacterium RIFCSPLOWO2_02_FULL_65_29]